MKILLVGGGGREHALAWKIGQSDRCEELWIAPGNPGTAREGRNVDISAGDTAGIITFARDNGVGLVVIGPEEPLARGLGALEEAVEAFSQVAEGVPAELELPLRRRIVRLLREDLEQPGAALPHLRRVWRLDPDDREVAAELAGLLEERGRWRELVEVVEADSERTTELAERVAHLMRVAEVRAQRLGEPQEALRVLDRVAQLDPANLEALARMEALHAGLGDTDLAVGCLEAQAARVTDPALSRDLRLRAARCWDLDLERPERARALYRDLAAEGVGAALDALEALALREGRWDELADVLGQRLEAAQDPAARSHVLARLAEVVGERLGDRARADGLVAELLELGEGLLRRLGRPEEAAACYEQALRCRPDDRRALAALTGAYRELQDWAAVDRCLARTLELLGEPEDRADAERVAETWTERGLAVLELGDRRAALEHLTRAVRTYPGARRARRALADYALSEGSSPVLGGG